MEEEDDLCKLCANSLESKIEVDYGYCDICIGDIIYDYEHLNQNKGKNE